MNSGFDGRAFLTADEWQTYMRRMPVRYIRRSKADVCVVCGLPASPDNPLEHSHRIPFRVGITALGLTPDFVDSPQNIVTAHKRGCNRSVELSLSECLALLASWGHKEIPAYLTPTNQSET
jgi:hypothetical protein